MGVRKESLLYVEQAEHIVSTTGVYRLAVTRDFGISCGSNGTYTLKVVANLEMTAMGQTVDDGTVSGTTYNCP